MTIYALLSRSHCGDWSSIVSIHESREGAEKAREAFDHYSRANMYVEEHTLED